MPAAPARTPTPSPSICVSWESFLGPAGEGVLTFVLWAQSQVISLDCRCHLSSAPVQPGAAQSQSALAGLQPLTHSNLVLPSEVKYRMEGAGGTPGPRPTPALLVSPSITFRLSADLTVLTATGRGPPPPVSLSCSQLIHMLPWGAMLDSATTTETTKISSHQGRQKTIEKWDNVKRKCFCTVKETINKTKRQPTEGRRYLQ